MKAGAVQIKKWLTIIFVTLVAIGLIFGAMYLLRNDPIGPIAGRALTGKAAGNLTDVSECNQHDHIGIESRSENPYSVLTWCFIHAGEMYVPALFGGRNNWPYYIIGDPKVRIKMGENVYDAYATRAALDLATFRDMMDSMADKYPTYRGDDLRESLKKYTPKELWLFRIAGRN